MLPNFCQGNGSGHINEFAKNIDNVNANNNIINSKNIGPSQNILYQRYLANKRSNESYNNWLQRYYQSLLPGQDPNYALNQKIPKPDGKNNYYSNAGTGSRYKDYKKLYYKEYLNTINLGIAILICLLIVNKIK